MLALLSPAKKQDFDTKAPTDKSTQITFQAEAAELVDCLHQYDVRGLSQLMSISDKLAKLNFDRFKTFHFTHFGLDNAKQALFAFQGDVYKGLDADNLTEQDILFAQDHIVMLSGLYGLLQPLDLIQPYRLEMKTKLKNHKGNNLYTFWGEKLTHKLNQWLNQQDDKIIVNLASNEYFHAIQPHHIKGSVVDIDFKEHKNGQFKTIAIYAKRARGLMARHIIRHQITDVGNLKTFAEAGYTFNDAMSLPHKLVFTR